MKDKQYAYRHSCFELHVEIPDEEHFSHGKISIAFLTPVIHFGWPGHYSMSMLPKTEQRRYAIREAIRGFASMIERELLKAAKDLDEKKES